MKTLTVKLKQHTPLIHFQHDQYGATLRASEVKPKLDRFILSKLGNGDYKKGCDEAKKNKWLIGKGEHNALNYKIKIITNDNDLVNFSLNLKINSDGKYTTCDFPLLLSNIGGRDTADELVNFSMYKNIDLNIFSINNDLYKAIKEYIPYFFANTNFGQRSNKGFGSFTVTLMEDEDGKVDVNSLGTNPYYISRSTLYMDFAIDKSMYSLVVQKNLFKIIDTFWNKLRMNVKESNLPHCNNISSVESYIKAMEEFPVNDDVQRIPAPVMFKPVSYKDEDGNNYYAVYIMFDEDMIGRLKRKYDGDEPYIDIGSDYALNADGINSLNYIDKFVDKFILRKYDNWKVKINKDKSLYVEFYEQ